jgi:hypothetical protein
LYKIIIFIFTISYIIFFNSCSTISRSFGIDTTDAKQQDATFNRGDYLASAKISSLYRDDLLSNLKAGNSFLFAKKYNNSTTTLNISEEKIKKQREQLLMQSTQEYISQLLLNDSVIEYKASINEGIMLNTYKALAYMAENKFDMARVELNRAIDRQRRAKDVYAKLIQKQEAAIRQERKSGTIIDTNTINSIAKSHYSNMANFRGYKGFINPFTTYLAGLFFKLSGDYTKSIDLLKEASGISPDNKTLIDDFESVVKVDKNKQQVWLIFENGLAPIKKELKLNIPVFVVSNKVSYVGIALPKLQPRRAAFKNISIQSDTQKARTTTLAQMDRVIQTEFKYSYKHIITRAVLSATLKAAAQYQASKSGGEYASLAVGLFSALTTHADTRSWSTLPKEFQVTKIDMPKNKKLSITYGLKHYNLQLDLDTKNAIVYVRIPTSTATPSISIINFKD